MAKIEIERKPQRSMWPLLLVLLVVAALAVAVYVFMLADDEPGADPMVDDTAVPGAVQPSGSYLEEGAPGVPPAVLLRTSDGEPTFEA
jgi:flagellar basal body-associated protein FliL